MQRHDVIFVLERLLWIGGMGALRQEMLPEGQVRAEVVASGR